MRRKLLPSRRLPWMICLALLSCIPTSAEVSGVLSVCGRVSLPNSYPAARITVNISGQNGYNSSTTTNDEGTYCFDGIPATILSLTIIPPKNAKYTAEPVLLNSSLNGPNFTVNIYTSNPLESSLPKEKAAKQISAKEASQKIPKNAKKALARAQQYKEEKNFNAALAELDKAIGIYPDYFQAFTEKGIVQIQSGHPQNALLEFDKARQILPDYEPALSGAGYCLLSMGEYEKAVALLEEAAEIDSTHAQTFLFLGIANLALSRWQKAQAALEHALKIDSIGSISAHLYLGDALAGQHLYERAADELHTYLQLNPDAPNADTLRNKEQRWRSLVTERH